MGKICERWVVMNVSNVLVHFYFPYFLFYDMIGRGRVRVVAVARAVCC